MKLLDKSGQNKKINNHPGPKSEVLNYMCSFYTVTLTLFEILIFFSFFFLFGNANQIFGIKRIRKPKRAVSSTSTAAMPPVLCVSWDEGEISHFMQLHVCISTPSFTVHLMYFHFINFPLFLQSVLLINTSALLSCFACLHFIFHIIPVLSNPFFHFQSFFCTIHLAAPLHMKP